MFRIRVGKPKPHREKDIGSYCPVQIETIDLKKIYTALGSDSIRAIQNALEMTGELILSRLRKIDPERLKFLNAEHIDFPYFKKPDEVSKELFVLISTLEKLNIQIEISNQSITD
ncbi:DUF6968 family protein [Leptospira noguchii]|uniref:DUF6968 family protein n=1 Tax=Leptospira noguchii TaxID=28182 RepID=UPI003BF9146A